MTAREKVLREYPLCTCEAYFGGIKGCPSKFGYLPDPECCDDRYPSEEHCTACWNREIPEKKKNEKMSDELIEKAYDEKYGDTSASSHMDYEAEIKRLKDNIEARSKAYDADVKRLKDIIESRDKEIRSLEREYDILKDRCIDQQATIDKYKAVIRCVEAFVGQKILEE